jgi:Dolichyl-phosphate-mannose-protein mannosyltransferase
VTVQVQGRGRAGRTRVLTRASHAMRRNLALLGLLWVGALACLVSTDYWCLRLTRLTVQVRVEGSSVQVRADGQTLSAALSAVPSGVTLVSGSAVLREYQVDGTDNTNNFTETPASVQTLEGNPYFAFLNEMRSSQLYSEWVGLRAIGANDRTVWSHEAVSSGRPYELPTAGTVTIMAALERPEAPATFTLSGASGPLTTLTIDRNDRVLALNVYTPDGQMATYTAPFFPMQPLPFLAEVTDSVVRVLIWALVLVGIEVLLALAAAGVWHAVATARGAREGQGARAGTGAGGALREAFVPGGGAAALVAGAMSLRRGAAGWWGAPAPSQRAVPGARVRAAVARLNWYDAAAAGLALGSLAFGLIVALVQFQGEPHILDASAYFFQAKIFASGQLSVPAPEDIAAFQGPFMVVWNQRWFAQYPPATSALLAVGILLHAPWLVEPVLGTAALIGVYDIGRRLYDRRTALLALGLLVISPFYVYQSASYLSHTVALAAEVGYLAALLWFARSHRARALALAGGSLSVMFAARELDAVLVGVLTAVWIAWSQRRQLVRDWRRVLVGAVAGAATLGCGLALYLAYNAMQTGYPFLLPRTLFSPADRYGFGAGVGFYGQHTVAAGLVNLDQQLTSLMIDLFGWPFYVTLALIPLAFLRRDSRTSSDALLLVLAGFIMVAQVGYFYHGIFLGPRYLFDTLPALALLCARGFGNLFSVCQAVLARIRPRAGSDGGEWPPRVAGAGLLCGLMACCLLFYWPRQWALYNDFSGLPASMHIDVGAVYHAHLNNALVITGSWYVYNYVLWPLNNPALNGNVIYAYAPTADDLSRLRSEYASRRMYLLTSDSQGHTELVLVP